MAHMHEIGGKAGAARGTSTPTTQVAKVRPGGFSLDQRKLTGRSSDPINAPRMHTLSAEVIQIEGT